VQAAHGAPHGMHDPELASAYMPTGHDATHDLVAASKLDGMAQEAHPELLADVQVRHVVSQG
jgi:hypothetical protein